MTAQQGDTGRNKPRPRCAVCDSTELPDPLFPGQAWVCRDPFCLDFACLSIRQASVVLDDEDRDYLFFLAPLCVEMYCRRKTHQRIATEQGQWPFTTLPPDLLTPAIQYWRSLQDELRHAIGIRLDRLERLLHLIVPHHRDPPCLPAAAVAAARQYRAGCIVVELLGQVFYYRRQEGTEYRCDPTHDQRVRFRHPSQGIPGWRIEKAVGYERGRP